MLRLTVAALVLFAAGCGSNNTGKIVGRWRAEGSEVGFAGIDDVIWEFGEDGAFTVTKVTRGTGAVEAKAHGRYALGVGNNVAFSGLFPPIEGKTRLAEKIAIDGDTMTVGGGKERAYRFTRLPPQ